MPNAIPMRNLLILICISVSANAFTASKSDKKHKCHLPQNKICQSIAKLHPNVDLDEAYLYSNTFFRVARKFKLDPKLLVSIAFQESAFRLGAVRKSRGLAVVDGEFKETAIGADFCMMQINSSNIIKLDIEPEKLLTDHEYCIKTGAKLLKGMKKRFAKKERYWWTRYNAKTPSKRRKYRYLVSRHLQKVEGVYGKKVAQRSISSK